MSYLEAVEPLPAVRHYSRARQGRILLIAVAVVIVLALAISGVRRLTRPAPPAEAPAIKDGFRPTPDQRAGLKIETVGEGQDPAALVVTGTISVDEEHSTPIVLPFSGQVGDVYVQAGQRVVRGQPLLRVASSDFVEARDALFAADAQRATAAAQLRTAQENARRQEALFRTAGGAEKDYIQAKSDLVAAQSAARSADAALGAARDKLALFGKTPDEVRHLEGVSEVAGIYSATNFRAPVSGTVASRDVAPGQFVSSGGDKPLMTITDLSRVWLIAQVPETEAAHVRLGDIVRVTTPAFPGRVFNARIDNIGAELDPATHRLPVRATVANPDEALKPQMFASFSIAATREPTAILVPASAVIREGDQARVWIAGRDGILRPRSVTIGDSGNGMVRITSGLKLGEQIVTAGAIFVNEAGLDG
ncbi:efflux RND transporter periplasmic adaptor subunit [Sphingomonas morindae]|uniref:Efflux RND transporter periplasmic adaptor subunit n=1 Tax=Sphingomonas morindae TaxID=1541170 RepID=A0ABY4X4X0_9SPHN|nr:efflux RND transporter periplasmic adaptor subunit [Sphingomonas morindae]USI71947.1 efflux RND transporter periplasmic adaptor subunit [Sphingomonas morindae]